MDNEHGPFKHNYKTKQIFFVYRRTYHNFYSFQAQSQNTIDNFFSIEWHITTFILLKHNHKTQETILILWKDKSQFFAMQTQSQNKDQRSKTRRRLPRDGCVSGSAATWRMSSTTLGHLVSLSFPRPTVEVNQTLHETTYRTFTKVYHAQNFKKKGNAHNITNRIRSPSLEEQEWPPQPSSLSMSTVNIKHPKKHK